jgi:hypothetical protein
MVTFDDWSRGSDDKAENREEEECGEHVQLTEEAIENNKSSFIDSASFFG